MEFLDKLVLPQSAGHIQLLHYMMSLVLFVYLPFVSLLLCGLALSLCAKRKAKKTQDTVMMRYSIDIIETAAFNKVVGFVLLIISPFVLTFIAVQLLHGIATAAVSFIFFGAIVGVPGVFLAFAYRYSYEIERVMEKFEPSPDADHYYKSALSLNNYSGPWALILMLFSVYFVFAGVVQGIYAPEAHFSIVTEAFIIKFLTLLAFGFLVTAAVMLFKYFYWDGGLKGESDEFMERSRKEFSKLAMFSGYALPVLVLLHIVHLPSTVVTAQTLLFAVLAVLMLFGLFHAIYNVTKKNNGAAMSWGLLFVIFTAMALIMGDQSALEQSTKMNSMQMAADFDSMMVKTAAAVAPPAGEEISGENIFNTKCSACHKWDVKLVGPPYKETLPKYEGKMDELISFITHPTKKNPDYPAMPEQGLKPKEVEAIAKYIMATYKTK